MVKAQVLREVTHFMLKYFVQILVKGFRCHSVYFFVRIFMFLIYGSSVQTLFSGISDIILRDRVSVCCIIYRTLFIVLSIYLFKSRHSCWMITTNYLLWCVSQWIKLRPNICQCNYIIALTTGFLIVSHIQYIQTTNWDVKLTL